MKPARGFVLYAALAGIAALAIMYALWTKMHEYRRERNEARARVTAMKESQEIEHANAQKELDIARDESATHAGLLRLCKRQVSVSRRAAGADAEAGTNPAAGELGDLASDIIAARRNGQRLAALQEWVRLNSAP